MKSIDVNRTVTSAALTESLRKKFNVNLDLTKYTRIQLENYRNVIRTKVFQMEHSNNFNDLLTHDEYQRDKFILGILNTRIKEMLGEAKISKPKCTCKTDKKSCAVHSKKDKKNNLKEALKLVGSEEHGEQRAEVYYDTFGRDYRVKYFENNSYLDGYDTRDDSEDEAFETARSQLGINESKKMDKKDKKEVCCCKKPGAKTCPVHGKIPVKKKKSKVAESNEKLNETRQLITDGIARFIMEDEEGKAKTITAATDIVGDITYWIQRVGNYKTKTMIELTDNIKANFGSAEAEHFNQSVSEKLDTLLNELMGVREQVSNAIAVLAGEAPATNPMGQDGMSGMPADPNAAIENNPVDAASADSLNGDFGTVNTDEFAASDAASGGPEANGRMQRESVSFGDRLMKILGT